MPRLPGEDPSRSPVVSRSDLDCSRMYRYQCNWSLDFSAEFRRFAWLKEKMAAIAMWTGTVSAARKEPIRGKESKNNDGGNACELSSGVESTNRGITELLVKPNSGTRMQRGGSIPRLRASTARKLWLPARSSPPPHPELPSFLNRIETLRVPGIAVCYEGSNSLTGEGPRSCFRCDEQP